MKDSPLKDKRTKELRWNGVTQAVRQVAQAQLNAFKNRSPAQPQLQALERNVANTLHSRFHDRRLAALAPEEAEARAIAQLSSRLTWMKDDGERQALALSEWKGINAQTRMRRVRQLTVDATYHHGEANIYGHLLWEMMTPQKTAAIRRTLRKYDLPNLYEEDLLNNVDNELYFIIDILPVDNFFGYAINAIKMELRQSVKHIMGSFAAQRPYALLSLDALAEEPASSLSNIVQGYEPSNEPGGGVSQLGELVLKAREKQIAGLAGKVVRISDRLLESGGLEPREHKIFNAYVSHASDIIRNTLRLTDEPIESLGIQPSGRSLGFNPASFNTAFNTARKKILDHSPELSQALEELFGADRKPVKRLVQKRRAKALRFAA